MLDHILYELKPTICLCIALMTFTFYSSNLIASLCAMILLIASTYISLARMESRGYL